MRLREIADLRAHRATTNHFNPLGVEAFVNVVLVEKLNGISSQRTAFS
jgi:hypothetical protein